MTAREKASLLERRRRLTIRINAFNRKADGFLKLDGDVRWSSGAGKAGPRAADTSLEDSESEEDPECEFDIESKMLPMPSSLAPGELQRLDLVDLGRREETLRRGQINDALEGLRLALGEKSLLFRKEIRNAKSQRTTTKAWDKVNKQDDAARKFRAEYNRARNALIRLGIDPEYLSTIHDITEADMKMSGDIVEENRVGQRSDVLAWFWRLGNTPQTDDKIEDGMQECKYSFLEMLQNAYVQPVYRVNWLRAKARHARWEEEVRLVSLEMGWIVNWFRHIRIEWQTRLDGVKPDDEIAGGLRSYAARQVSHWRAFENTAVERFQNLRNTTGET